MGLECYGCTIQSAGVDLDAVGCTAPCAVASVLALHTGNSSQVALYAATLSKRLNAPPCSVSRDNTQPTLS